MAAHNLRNDPSPHCGLPVKQLKNPYTGAVIAEYALETFESANAKITNARAAQQAWAKVPLKTRQQLFLQALDAIEPDLERYASRISDEMFKPVTHARQELAGGMTKLRRLADLAEDALRERNIPAGEKSFEFRIRRVPKGVIYTIAPWNYPFFTALNSIGPALLAGNAVVLKHENTPSVGELFHRTFDSMGGINGLCQHLSIDIPTSDRVILESSIDHIVFTGSVAGGASITRVAAQRAANPILREGFLQVSLELGGSDAAYVAGDADPVAAARMLVSSGRLHNSGQSCCATKRLFLHPIIAEPFLAEAKTLMEAEVSGDPQDPLTTMGPLYGGPAAIDFLTELVEDAVVSGARIETGGDTFEKDGFTFLRPTLLTGATTRMRIMQEETFGPVLPVAVVADDDEALSLINHPLFGLTTAVFTNDPALQERVLGEVQSGTVYFNWCNDVQPEVAWNGWGRSGNGMAAMSELGFQALTRTQSVVKALPSA
jgi:acyl-CoA reductase-like NAD-dependent aldehyde dehydrogenase